MTRREAADLALESLALAFTSLAAGRWRHGWMGLQNFWVLFRLYRESYWEEWAAAQSSKRNARDTRPG